MESSDKSISIAEERKPDQFHNGFESIKSLFADAVRGWFGFLFIARMRISSHDLHYSMTRIIA